MTASRTLVLLNLNEIEGLKVILPKLPREQFDELVAVDGGSTDGSLELLLEQEIRVIKQRSRGRGEAFRLAATETMGEHLLFFSPDGNEDPADIPKLFQLLDQGHQMAIASRFLPESRNEEDDQFFRLRKWANQGFGLIANLIWNRKQRITDTINGFRAIKRSSLIALDTRSIGFTIEYELTIRSFKQGFSVAEIPTLEGDRIGGQSTATSIRTGLFFLRFLFLELFRK